MKKRCFLIFALIVFAAISTFAQIGLCGSVQKYNQTKRWQDLPGCPIEFGGDNASAADKALNSLKYKYKEFYETWNTKIDDSDFFRDFELDDLRPGDEYEEEWESNPKLIAAKQAYEDAFRQVRQRIKWYEIIESADSSLNANLSQAVRYIKQKENPDRIKNSLENGVLPVLQKLKAAGAPDDLIVAKDADKKIYTIGEIKALMPGLQASQKEVEAKVRAEWEAKWRPFLNVLKGDRLELFKKYEVGVLYGVGGKLLDTPEEFSRTPIMATVTIDESGLVYRWNMTIYRFRGDKIVATETKSGWGRSAPSSAYR